MTHGIEESSVSPFFIDNKGDDMSDLEITRDDDKIVGTKKSTAFEMDTEKETIYFWKSSYTWEELFQIMEYIKEHRELNAQPEEAPF